jgi:hypothetical protein
VVPADTPERENARAVIVAEVDRLHWRIWNGKARDAKVNPRAHPPGHAGIPR